MPPVAAVTEKLLVLGARHHAREDDLALNVIPLLKKEMQRRHRGQRIGVRVIVWHQQNPALPRQNRSKLIQMLAHLL